MVDDTDIPSVQTSSSSEEAGWLTSQEKTRLASHGRVVWSDLLEILENKREMMEFYMHFMKIMGLTSQGRAVAISSMVLKVCCILSRLSWEAVFRVRLYPSQRACKKLKVTASDANQGSSSIRIGHRISPWSSNINHAAVKVCSQAIHRDVLS